MAASYHPIFVDLKDRSVLIVGGGAVAVEKIHSLLPTGAKIRVVSPRATGEVRELARNGDIEWVVREFRDDDVDFAFMAIAASDAPDLNGRVFRLAEASKKLANSVDDPANCNFIMAAITKKGPIQVAVSSAGCSPALAQRLRDRIRDEILTDAMGDLTDFLGSNRGQVKGALATYQDRKLFWEAILDSDVPSLLESEGRTAAQLRFDEILASRGGACNRPESGSGETVARARSGTAGETSPKEAENAKVPESHASVSGSPSGCITLVGAGPGDPELLTIKGLRALQEADVVLYDRLANPALLSHAPAHAIRVDVGKAPGDKGTPRQETINALMIEHARRGRKVVRLKGGDPFVFGRGGEELVAAREAGIPCEVVPGISSAIAGPGAAGIPVTHRGLSTGFAVFTAHGSTDVDSVPWEAAARIPTLVLLMGVERMPHVVGRLREFGRVPETPVAVISNATLPHQQVAVGTLSTIEDRALGLPAPAVIVIGEVVRLASVNELLSLASSVPCGRG